jgi:hypothetical protein
VLDDLMIGAGLAALGEHQHLPEATTRGDPTIAGESTIGCGPSGSKR